MMALDKIAKETIKSWSARIEESHAQITHHEKRIEELNQDVILLIKHITEMEAKQHE